MTPGEVIFVTNKYQASHKLMKEPFEQVLKKLPELVRPGVEGPSLGPLNHPNEPVWFEMTHRLQTILKRQGRRAERRRKRKMRAKLATGHARGPAKRSDGRNLREYL